MPAVYPVPARRQLCIFSLSVPFILFLCAHSSTKRATNCRRSRLILVLTSSSPRIILDDDELLLSLVAIVVLNPSALCVINAPPAPLLDFTPVRRPTGIVLVRLQSWHMVEAARHGNLIPYSKKNCI